MLTCISREVHPSTATTPTPRSAPTELKARLLKTMYFTDTYPMPLTPHDIFGMDADTQPECVICLEAPRNAVLLPCRHLCVCDDCLREIDSCPICRSPFARYITFQGAQDGSGRLKTD